MLGALRETHACSVPPLSQFPGVFRGLSELMSAKHLVHRDAHEMAVPSPRGNSDVLRDLWWLISIVALSMNGRKEEWGILLVREGCNAQVGVFKTMEGEAMEGEGMVGIDLGVHMHLPRQV